MERMSFLIDNLQSEAEFSKSLEEQRKIVAVRFGTATNLVCRHTDSLLFRLKDPLERFYSIFACETRDVPALAEKYALCDEMKLMFFYRKRLLTLDLGEGKCDGIDTSFSGRGNLLDVLVIIFQHAMRDEQVVQLYLKRKKSHRLPLR